MDVLENGGHLPVLLATLLLPNGIWYGMVYVNLYSAIVANVSNAPMNSNCYFRASGQTSDTAAGFSDPEFLRGTDILAITGHLPCDVDL